MPAAPLRTEPRPSPQNDGIDAAYTVLFAAFEKNNIPWCAWKSNEHLAEGLNGLTDMDVLFEPADRARIANVMQACGFVLFVVSENAAYPGVVSYLSVNPGTGRILHTHCHFLLPVGERRLKSLMLPWGPRILAKRIASEEESGVYIAPPAEEMVLLIVREALKIRWRDLIRHQDDRDSPWGGKDFRKELAWLNARVSVDAVAICAKELLDGTAAILIRDMLEQDFTLRRLETFNRHVLKLATERNWRRLGPFAALYQTWFREILWMATRIAEKTGVLPEVFTRKHVLPGEGLVVAFVGPDGAGKSTVTQTIIAQSAHKIDMAHVYFGTGDGPQIWLQHIVKFSLRAGIFVRNVIRKHRKIQPPATAGIGHAGRSVSRGTILVAVASVFGKRRQMKHVFALRKRGLIVVCDRWPHPQSLAMDGPLLTGLKDDRNSFYRFLAGWEQRQYRKITARQPDIIVKLLPTLETSISRKAENLALKSSIEQKITALQALDFPGAGETHVIDANPALHIVLGNVRTVLWNRLRRRKPAALQFYECFGFPGAGKTTVCKEVFSQQIMKSFVDIFFPPAPLSRLEKAGIALESFTVDPLIYIHIAELAIRFRLYKSMEALTGLSRLPAQKRRLQIAPKDRPYLLEQLLLQNLWSALVFGGVKTISPAALSPFIARLYHGLSVEVFYFDIDAATAAARVSERKNGVSFFDGLPEEKAIGKMQPALKLMEDILQAALYAGIPVVALDARPDSDKVLKEFLTLL